MSLTGNLVRRLASTWAAWWMPMRFPIRSWAAVGDKAHPFTCASRTSLTARSCNSSVHT